eukprot:scaffold382_cov380-Prasinococcus_capsulatus_cf.AAC.12
MDAWPGTQQEQMNITFVAVSGALYSAAAFKVSYSEHACARRDPTARYTSECPSDGIDSSPLTFALRLSAFAWNGARSHAFAGTRTFQHWLALALAAGGSRSKRRLGRPW